MGRHIFEHRPRSKSPSKCLVSTTAEGLFDTGARYVTTVWTLAASFRADRKLIRGTDHFQPLSGWHFSSSAVDERRGTWTSSQRPPCLPAAGSVILAELNPAAHADSTAALPAPLRSTRP